MARKRRRARRRNTKQDNRKRNLLILSGVILVIVLAATLFLVTRQTEQIETDRPVWFQEARENPRLRQAYLDQAVSRYSIVQPDSVKRIRYEPEQEFYEQIVGREGSPPKLGLIRPVEKTVSLPKPDGKRESELLIFPVSFELASERELLITFRHEFLHGQQDYEGKVRQFPSTRFRSMDDRENVGLWHLAGELDAIQNVDLRIMPDEDPRKNAVYTLALRLYEALWHTNAALATDPEFVSQLKIEFFEAGMMEILLERTDGSFVFRGTEFVLTKEEMDKIKQKLGMSQSKGVPTGTPFFFSNQSPRGRFFDIILLYETGDCFR